ncbi:MAG: hypothetical protein RR326_16345, partial [Stenotrophomonas sp.]
DGGASEAMATAQALPAEVMRVMAAYRTVGAWVDSHFAAFTLMLLPIEALLFWQVFRRYSQLNYPEWLVMITLLTVQVFVIWSVLVLLHRWLPQVQLMAALLGMIYNAVSLVQFFQDRPVWSTIWRTAVSLMLFSLVSSLALMVAALVVMRVG